jgi:hypothetical protein
MHNLQELRVVSAKNWNDRISMPMLTQLITTAAQLRVLELSCGLDQQEMDLLLNYAPQLTRLKCRCLTVTEDRSQSACSWAELELTHGTFSQLACLPLHSIQLLRSSELKLPSPNPFFYFGLVEEGHAGHLTELAQIRDAVTNLGRCQAWQRSGSAARCWMGGAPSLLIAGAQFDWRQSLVEMFAALSGLAVKQLDLTICADEVCFDASLLEQLSSILGSSLTDLEVEAGHICRDFWPAVYAHLPGLQCLSLGRYIDMSNIHLEDLGAFCTHAARPLQLCFDEHLMEDLGPAARLQALGSIWGAPQVTISFYFREG